MKPASSFLCLDCGIDTGGIGHYYMLDHALWKRINPAHAGMLCLNCCETRLGRELFPTDFLEAPVNLMYAKALAPRFAHLDYAHSVKLAQQIGAIPKQCYSNCFLAVYGRADLAQAVYVEGFAYAGFFPVEHAWIELEGRIIDPTWALLFSETEMLDFAYFGVYRYSQAEARKHKGKRRKLDLPTYGPGSWNEDRRFQRAYLEANRHTGGDQVVNLLLSTWKMEYPTL